MAFYTVNDLKGALGGGNAAMSNKYAIVFGTPAGDPSLALGPDAPILCSATSFPSKKINEVDVWVQGRKLILPGDTAFESEWKLTFYQRADHNLRKMFIKWMNKIDDYASNSHTCDPASLMIEAEVHQLSCESTVAAKYKFFNMFPTDVGEIALSADAVQNPQTFTVAFKYSHWDIIE
jgi:hypothetical protein